MKKQRALGLLAAGRISPAVARLPRLADQLGPVKAASFRVASRLVNRLRAGFATASFDPFEYCRVVLISVPDEDLSSWIAEMARAGRLWAKKTVVLCDSALDSRDLTPLARLGAHVATLSAASTGPAAAYVVEGQADAVREVRRLFRNSGCRLLEVARGKKALYSAGLAFAGTLFLPLVSASADCLRRAGLTSAQAVDLAQATFQQTLRAYVKAGRKGWSGALRDRDLEAVRRQVEALGVDHPVLGAYFAETARLALAVLGEDPEWLRALEHGRAASA